MLYIFFIYRGELCIVNVVGRNVKSWKKIISQDGVYANLYSEECPFCGAPSNFQKNSDLDQLKHQKDIQIKNSDNQYVI